MMDAPVAKQPDPQPPSPEEAAQIVDAAWEDPDWGTFVWLTMTTGAQRGELCALRWSNVDPASGGVRLRGEHADPDHIRSRQPVLCPRMNAS